MKSCNYIRNKEAIGKMHQNSESIKNKNVKQFLLWIALGVVLILTLIPMVAYYNSSESKRIVSMNIIVEARYEAILEGSRYFKPIYIYRDENDVLYKGYGPAYTYKEQAEARLGDTIMIYIDGNGKSRVAGEYLDRRALYLALSVTGGVIALGILTTQIIMRDRWKEKK